MKVKPSKSRGISIIRGKVVDQKFHTDKTTFLSVSELPVKSLGRLYNASLKDRDQSDQLREETIKGLASIDLTSWQVETVVSAVRITYLSDVAYYGL